MSAAEGDAALLSYAAPPGCPSSEQFEARVSDRLRRGRLARRGEPARTYRVRIRERAGEMVALLEVRDESGELVTREVSAPSCEEVVRAMALVVALAIDAQVERAEPAATGPAPQSPAPSSRERSRDTTPVSTAPPATMRAPEPPRASARWQLGARMTLSTPKAPRPLPGLAAFVGVGGARPRWSVEAEVAGELGARVERGPGEARFSFVGGRLLGCLVAAELGGGFSLGPCALGEAGVLVAEGFIERPRTVRDPWFALGLAARLSVALGDGVLRVQAGPVFPLRNEDRFVFGDVTAPDAITVHDVPPAGLYLSVGGGYNL